jgi:hypothetical protein
MTLLLKDPAAVLDYAIDWGAEYLGEGDLIAESSWSVDPEETEGVAVVGSDFGERRHRRPRVPAVEPRGHAVRAHRRTVNRAACGEALMVALAQPIITMSEAQAYVRIETGEEEALLAGLIRTASGLCEAFINQVVVARDFELDVPASSAWERQWRRLGAGCAARQRVAASRDRPRRHGG